MYRSIEWFPVEAFANRAPSMMVAFSRDGAHSLGVDVANTFRSQKLSSTVRQSRIDILVNSAGYLGAYRPFHELDAAEWQKIIEVNLLSVLGVTRKILPLMRRAGRGRIVNMGSLAGKEGLPNL